MSKTKFVSIEEAVELIKPNTSIGVGGFWGFGAPDSILKRIQKNTNVQEGYLNKLTIVTSASVGDVSQNKIAAYMLPL